MGCSAAVQKDERPLDGSRAIAHPALMSAPVPPAISHGSVLRIAIPIVLSNVSEPMIGVVNTAVMGRLPEPYYIGGVAVGALIFSFLFWGFGFLRLSTGGLAAQATGANDKEALVTLLGRSLVLAATIGLALIATGPWIGPLAVTLVGGSADVMREAQTYFAWRIWSAPGALINYAVMGWFIGQGRANIAFFVQLFLNLSNMTLSMIFVLGLGMATAGVGLAVIIAEYAAAGLGLLLALRQFLRMGVRPPAAVIFDRAKFTALVAANGDIMVRSLALVFGFAWFVSRGAKQGDLIVAANAVVLNLFEVAAYMIDGFAYAAEALVGQAVGARDRARFWRAIRLTTLWAGVLSLLCALVIIALGTPLIAIMTTNAEVQETASHYMLWAALATVLGAACFQFDGIFTGAMATREMRNMMLVSLAAYLVSWWFLEPAFGNHGLWAALNIFFVARGITFAASMPVLERRAFGAGS
ncbi:MAG: MATE family efflux transporter [Proteobacteria bacterium]|nr:MATE family efflux transporter [Pseudomonadota bacterium]